MTREELLEAVTAQFRAFAEQMTDEELRQLHANAPQYQRAKDMADRIIAECEGKLQ